MWCLVLKSWSNICWRSSRPVAQACGTLSASNQVIYGDFKTDLCLQRSRVGNTPPDPTGGHVQKRGSWPGGAGGRRPRGKNSGFFDSGFFDLMESRMASTTPWRRPSRQAPCRRTMFVSRRPPTQFVCRVLGMNQCRASLFAKQHKQVSRRFLVNVKIS